MATVRGLRGLNVIAESMNRDSSDFMKCAFKDIQLVITLVITLVIPVVITYKLVITFCQGVNAVSHMLSISSVPRSLADHQSTPSRSSDSSSGGRGKLRKLEVLSKSVERPTSTGRKSSMVASSCDAYNSVTVSTV